VNISDAIELCSRIIYKPNFVLWAEDHSDRFEGCVAVNVMYDAPNFNRENAPDYSVPAPGPNVKFVVEVSSLDNAQDFYREVLEGLLRIEQHESREAFRIAPSYDSPFHPHTVSGITSWGNPQADYTFGLV